MSNVEQKMSGGGEVYSLLSNYKKRKSLSPPCHNPQSRQKNKMTLSPAGIKMLKKTLRNVNPSRAELVKKERSFISNRGIRQFQICKQLKEKKKKEYEDLKWKSKLIPSIDFNSERSKLSNSSISLEQRAYALLSSSPKLLLPPSYQLLLKVFIAFENTVSVFCQRRNGYVTFNEIKMPIENQCHITFTKKHLAQIVYLFPEVYQLQTMDVPNDFGVNCKQIKIVVKKFNAYSLIKRRKECRPRLLAIVHQHHEKFLSRQKDGNAFFGDKNESLESKRQKLRIWHPKFQLENVPSIPTVKLPDMNPKTKNVNRDPIAWLNSTCRPVAKTFEVPKPPKKISKGLRGVSSRLIAKCRAYDAMRGKRDEIKKEINQRTQAQELVTLAYRVRSLLVSKKRWAMNVNQLVQLLINTSIGKKQDYKKLLIRMTETVPEWAKIVTIGIGLNQREIFQTARTQIFSLVLKKLKYLTQPNQQSIALTAATASMITTKSLPTPIISAKLTPVQSPSPTSSATSQVTRPPSRIARPQIASKMIATTPQTESKMITTTPQTKTRKTATPQTKTRRTATPQTKTRRTATPQTKTRRTATPQTKTRRTATPQIKTRRTATPQTRTTRRTATPQIKTRRTATPQSRRTSTPQSGSRTSTPQSGSRSSTPQSRSTRSSTPQSGSRSSTPQSRSTRTATPQSGSGSTRTATPHTRTRRKATPHTRTRRKATPRMRTRRTTTPHTETSRSSSEKPRTMRTTRSKTRAGAHKGTEKKKIKRKMKALNFR